MKQRILHILCASVLLVSMGLSARAFSLRSGTRDTWQTPQIGYGVFPIFDLGGPVNLGEEFRLNVPVLTYGFDATFLNYFGSNGIAAVDAAFKILNEVPNANAMSATLAEFPTQTKLNNFAAGNLGLVDLKSTVLGLMVAQMGLADPERFAWTLRDRQTFGTPQVTNYLVIKRNFDPITLNPSSFVNGTLYTYTIREGTINGQSVADAEETPADPQATAFTSVAQGDDQGSPRSQNRGIGAGEFYTGLTRDDMGGLRYLLRFNNFNVETLAPGVTNVSTTGLAVFGPILPPFGNSLFGPGGSVFNSPWGVPFGGAVTNAAVGVSSNAINTALRPGIGKIIFQKVLFDSLLYSVLQYTNVFSDAIITNSILTNQMVQRVQSAPDILFTAGDLGIIVAAGIPSPIRITRSQLANWVPNVALNSFGGGATVVGPGQINPGSGAVPAITINLSKIAPYFNNSTPFFLNEGNSTQGFAWGWFDTANIFAVFPDGTTVLDLERQVLAR